MKISFFTLLFLVLSSQLFSQVVILVDEDFNSGFPSSWQVIDNDGLTPNAQVSQITSGFGYLEDGDSTGMGDSIVACTSWFTSPGTADNYLILPQITLENHGNILFWDVKSEDPSYPDGYEILISTSLPVIDSFKLDSAIFYTDAEFPYWTARSISLDSFINQTIYIAFHHFSTDKFILNFDNIRVTADTTLSVPVIHDDLAFDIYPNPASDYIYITTKNDLTPDDIKIYNVTGKLIYSESNSKRVAISSLASGMYFMEVFSDNSRGVKRIVVSR